MNSIIEKELNIEDMIYEIRGKQVMLDSDLAKLYECKNGTKEINQSVSRNKEKFSERYTSPINVAKGSTVYCYAISSDGYISYTNRYVVF